MSILNKIKGYFPFEDNNPLIPKERILELNKQVKFWHSVGFIVSFIILIFNYPLGFLVSYLIFALLGANFLRRYRGLSPKNYFIKYNIFIYACNIIYLVIFYISFIRGV